MIKDAFIVNCIRTPIGKAGGSLKDVRPDDLLSFILESLMSSVTNIDPSDVDDVIIGCAMPEAEQGLNIARISSLLAGFPNSVPGVTINRFCASGLQSISYAADQIKLGTADIIIAGGVESMSMIPLMGHHPSLNPNIFKDDNIGLAYGMGATAEEVATKYGITRILQDEFAYISHQRAINAHLNDLFNSEIIPFRSKSLTFNPQSRFIHDQSIVLNSDEGIRFDTSMDKLSSLNPAFSINGTVTAGNSSQMSDGASVVLICSKKAILRYNLTPMARFIGYSVSGVDPKLMGIGPTRSIPRVLDQFSIHVDDIGHIELNEAFAAQSLAVINHLNLDPEIVNPLGGAIALGHPLGASGAIRSTTLLHNMTRNKIRYGMVTMCIGSGMGASAIFENIL